MFTEEQVRALVREEMDVREKQQAEESDRTWKQMRAYQEAWLEALSKRRRGVG